MRIAIIGQKEQFEAIKILIKKETVSLTPFQDIDAIAGNFDGIFDFSFVPRLAHIEKLKVYSNCVFINSVCYPLENNNSNFIRFNGWNSFIERDLLEIAVSEKSNPSYKEQLAEMGIPYLEVPDITGLVSPRIVSMIINEAYFALEEKISSKEEIDIAMQLGTNYPLGPFAWSEKIGLCNIAELLLKLGEQDERYTIAKALLDAAKKTN
jgi:3-hydroxybutyryl-CoA dehydrogenase